MAFVLFSHFMKSSEILINGLKQARAADAPSDMVNSLKLAIASDALAQLALADNEFARQVLEEISEQTIARCQAANDKSRYLPEGLPPPYNK